MPRVKVGPAVPDQTTIEVEVTRLRDLDLISLRRRWQTAFRRAPPGHLGRHLLFRMLAYRLQADAFGDLDADSRRLLDGAGSPEAAGQRVVDRSRLVTDLRPGTILAREWAGHMHRVAVLADGFACNGKTYPSLSKGRLRDHRHPLERAPLLRTAGQGHQQQSWGFTGQEGYR